MSDGFGAFRVMRWIAAAYLGLALAVGFAQSAAMLAVALCMFGMCHGAMDVAINSWAAHSCPRSTRCGALGAGLGEAQSTLGYAAFSITMMAMRLGPSAIGFIAHATSLRIAFLVVSGSALLTVLFATALSAGARRVAIAQPG